MENKTGKKTYPKSDNNMKKPIEAATAPGKLIILGEYAVLESAPALVAAVNKDCRVEIRPRKGGIFKFEAPNLGMKDILFSLDRNGTAILANGKNGFDKKPGFVFSLLKYIITQIGAIASADITIDTSDFYHKKSTQKLGIGSSAALTVAFLKALSEYLGIQFWSKSLFQEALRAHRIAQGKIGSGVDIAASTTGGIIEYRMPELIENLDGKIDSLVWPENLEMIPIWTGCSTSTRKFVQNVNKYRDSVPKKYDQIMKKMHEICEEGSKAFRKGDAEAFLEIVPLFAKLEEQLGLESGTDIISAVHKKINQLVSQSGGVYKPSGAGGGDIGVAFCNSPDIREKIIRIIAESPFEILDLAIQKKGLSYSYAYED